MDYDDEILAMDSEEAEILEEAGIEANIGACASCHRLVLWIGRRQVPQATGRTLMYSVWLLLCLRSGTVEVQGESEIVDACLNCDCSRVLIINTGATSFKSWNIHSFERIFRRRTRKNID